MKGYVDSPGGAMQLRGQDKEKLDFNPIFGILGLQDSLGKGKRDFLFKTVKDLADLKIDIIFSFSGLLFSSYLDGEPYFQASKYEEKDRKYKEDRYGFSPHSEQIKIISETIGFIQWNIQLLNGLRCNSKNYFWNKIIP